MGVPFLLKQIHKIPRAAADHQNARLFVGRHVMKIIDSVELSEGLITFLNVVRSFPERVETLDLRKTGLIMNNGFHERIEQVLFCIAPVGSTKSIRCGFIERSATSDDDQLKAGNNQNQPVTAPRAHIRITRQVRPRVTRIGPPAQPWERLVPRSLGC